jgi:hypothetical protein
MLLDKGGSHAPFCYNCQFVLHAPFCLRNVFKFHVQYLFTRKKSHFSVVEKTRCYV